MESKNKIAAVRKKARLPRRFAPRNDGLCLVRKFRKYQ